MSRSRDRYPFPNALVKHGTSVCYCWACIGMRGPSRAKDSHARKLRKAERRDVDAQVNDYDPYFDPKHPEYSACRAGACDCNIADLKVSA